MTQADRPNILIILSDQHSPHMLGCYGDELVRTPNLDRLAAEGMAFDHTLLTKLHADWDPDEALAVCAADISDMNALAAWGRAVQPRHPDELDAPPPSVEDNIELL